MIEVKFKKLVPEAKIPTYAKPGDAGMDLTATSYEYDEKLDNHTYGIGLAVEIPEGYVGLIFPRSSNRKTTHYLTNHVGVIDSGYRGEIMCTFKSRDHYKIVNGVASAIQPDFIKLDGRFVASEELHAPYNVGDRIAQLIIMPYPQIAPIEVTELSETERGEGGFGSTGTK